MSGNGAGTPKAAPGQTPMIWYGVHRSLEPPGVLPQQARRLDVRSPLRKWEMAVDVDYLNIDSASWRQIRQECDGDLDRMKNYVLQIVSTAGKMQNPVTGSGGLLEGTVIELGPGRSEPPIGTRICSLVSLTLTPLILQEIVHLDPSTERVQVSGRAILFGSSMYAVLPEDLPAEACLRALDVCGAPAWAAKLTKLGDRVVVMGAGGKSGLLVLSQVSKLVGSSGRVLGLCWPPETVSAVEEMDVEAIAVDCTDAFAVQEGVRVRFHGQLGSLIFNCANVRGCEAGAILACEDDGMIVHFSMATSFASAALAAEGVGKYPQMLIGSGYLPGHAHLVLDLLRTDSRLLQRMIT